MTKAIPANRYRSAVRALAKPPAGLGDGLPINGISPANRRVG